MKILIVEDETVAYENLVEILAEIDPSIEIMGNAEGISQTIHWLQTHPAPDLILMDIHLSDGSAFSIFDNIQVETPVIFTTAYDEYAIKAFKVNSVDYLLKPVKVEELSQALKKFSRFARADVMQYLNQLAQLTQQTSAPKYKDRILIPYKDKLLPVAVGEISCIYTTDKNTTIFLKNGINYPYARSLDQIITTLDPAGFIRANKQFIVARDSVKNLTIWFDGRLLLTLDVEPPERIYISKNKAAEFKAWIVRE